MERKQIRTLTVQNPARPGSAVAVPVDKPKSTRAQSTAQRLAAYTRDNKVERYIAQEEKRAPRVQADSRGTLRTVLVLASIAVLTSAVISFNGITSVAGTVGLAFEWQSYMFFGFIELLIFVFTMLYLIKASQINDETGLPDKATGAFWGLIVFSGLAILANAFHTLEYHVWNLTIPQTYMGVVLSVSAPIAIIWLTKIISGVVFAKAIFLDVPKLGRPAKAGK